MWFFNETASTVLQHLALVVEITGLILVAGEFRPEFKRTLEKWMDKNASFSEMFENNPILVSKGVGSTLGFLTVSVGYALNGDMPLAKGLFWLGVVSYPMWMMWLHSKVLLTLLFKACNKVGYGHATAGLGLITATVGVSFEIYQLLTHYVVLYEGRFG